MSDFVMVGCRLPHGLVIDIRDETGAVLESHKLNGNRLPRTAQGLPILGAWDRANDRGPEEQSAGLTRVPRAFWEYWRHHNAQYQPVRAGLIFAHDDTASVAAMAVDLKGVRNGLEPLDPFKPGPNLKPEDSKVGIYEKSIAAGRRAA